jgi:hypothetical protein
MQRTSLIFTLVLSAVLINACGQSKNFVMQEPQADRSLLIGAVLVENAGLEDVYEAKKANITVIIVGKSDQQGNETSQGYRVKTNEDGYFLIANVPPGSYVVKGFEVDLGYETHLLIGSYWDENIQVFRPEQLMINYTVQVWPPPSDDRIINMDIRYFRIDAAHRVAYDTFKRIESAAISIPEIKHTILNPLDYFKMKYPNSSWFKQ